MKSKIVSFILLLFLAFPSKGQLNYVPDTNTFSLWDVLDAVTGGHASGSLSSAFAGANYSYFDSNYDNVNYAPAQSMKRFRNYKPLILTIPTVTTAYTGNLVGEEGQTQAYSGGEVTSDGGSSVTARGVCWSTTQFPTTANSKTIDGSGTGVFSSSITGLTPSTTYYVRAYATNSQGTSYGSQQSITTNCLTPDGLTTYGYVRYWNASPNNVTSQATAIQCLNDVQNNGVGFTIGGYFRISSLTTNNVAFSTIVNDCTSMGLSSWFVATNAGSVVQDYVYYLALGGTLTAYYCAKASVTTGSSYSTGLYTATSGGNVTAENGTSVTARGVCWNTTGLPTITNSKTVDGSGTGSFSSSLTGLSPSTTYYIRAYATNSMGTSYGSQTSITTDTPITTPTVTTTSVSSITSSSATSGGNVTADGGATVTARGICWNATGSPTIANNTYSGGSGTGSFTGYLTGLTGSTTYYIRAYATNSAGTSYGGQVQFTTSPTLYAPTVTTTSASAITFSGATFGGNVTSDGGSAITERGVCYGVTSNPTISGSKVTSTGTTGSFSINMSGLSSCQFIYYRAYATNAIGTSYGTQYTLTTIPYLPSLTTTSASSVGETTATSGGNVTSDGCTAMDASTSVTRGICYSTSQNPTTSNSTVSGGSGTGSFSCSMTGLSSGTTYYVRAYATNSSGTEYGSQVSFTTSTPVVPPTVTLSSIISNAEPPTSVDAYGNLTSLGGAEVTEYGFCWSASNPSPTLADSYDISNFGTHSVGSFYAPATYVYFTQCQTYYGRVYATNSAGTGYSNVIQFTYYCPVSPPTVSTTSASSITNTSMSTGGNVTSDGGATVTARGVVYNTTGSPTLSDNVITSGSGTGSFTSNMTGLTGNTYYYYRAYATNSAGTGYGLQGVDTTYPTVTWSFTSGGTGDYINITKNGTQVVNTTSSTSGSFQVAWGDEIVVTVEGGSRDYNECHLTQNGSTSDDIQATPAQSSVSATVSHNISITASTHN